MPGGSNLDDHFSLRNPKPLLASVRGKAVRVVAEHARDRDDLLDLLWYLDLDPREGSPPAMADIPEQEGLVEDMSDDPCNDPTTPGWSRWFERLFPRG